MGLREALSRAAVSRAHVYVVEVPGMFRTRAALERAVLQRGWTTASSPADADVLVVCGEQRGYAEEPVEQLWEAMPGPRVRIVIASEVEVAAGLARAADDLLDPALHRSDARDRVNASASSTDMGGMEHGGIDHGIMDMGGMDMGGMDMGGMDMGGMDMGGMDMGGMDMGGMDMGGMDMGGMDMAPAGIPLAEGAQDRDGLEMDVLHLRLGPVLTHWPPGFVLHCRLHGDVAVDARAELLPGPDGSANIETPSDLETAARRLDTVASLLALAGWTLGQRLALLVRDSCLDGDVQQAAGGLSVLRRRVDRARLLRWMLRDLGRLDAGVAQRRGLREGLSGDVHDRLRALLDLADQDLRGVPSPPVDVIELVDLLPELVNGLELASLRLVVASLDLRPVPAGQATHG